MSKRYDTRNKKAHSLYLNKEVVRLTRILLLKTDDSTSLSQLVENLLNLNIEKVLEGDRGWVKSVMTKVSKDKGSE